jgi:hypothetical protein
LCYSNLHLLYEIFIRKTFILLFLLLCCVKSTYYLPFFFHVNWMMNMMLHSEYIRVLTSIKYNYDRSIQFRLSKPPSITLLFPPTSKQTDYRGSLPSHLSKSRLFFSFSISTYIAIDNLYLLSKQSLYFKYDSFFCLIYIFFFNHLLYFYLNFYFLR